MTRNDIAAQIVKHRKVANLTQVEAAERAGVTQSIWSRVEKCEDSVAPDTLVRMAAVVGLEVEYVEEFRVVKKAKRT